MCQRIKDNLEEYKIKNGINDENDNSDGDDDSNGDVPLSSQETNSQPLTQKKPRKKTSVSLKANYVPKPRSGAFALLIALIKAEVEEDKTTLSKSEVQERATPYSDESMVKPKAGSHFTAFNSMKTLIKNGMVDVEHHRYAYYSLTEAGRELSLKLLSFIETGPHVPSSQASKGGDDETTDQSSQEPSSQTSSQRERFSLSPGEFEIILVVDSREQTSGVQQNMRKTALISELTQKGVNAEMRVLQVGDFAWVARETASGRSRELILDHVVERKRVDDLASSIVDGRFHEQKHRLKICGIRNPTYLVESLTRGEYSVPFRSLQSAVANSQIIDGFNIKYMKDYNETIMYLVSMTRSLTSYYQKQTLYSCSLEEMRSGKMPRNYFMTIPEFEKSSRKITNFTSSEMFFKHLIQFSGCSVVKAKSIIDVYPTVQDLLSAYNSCESLKEKEKMLSNLKYGNPQRNLGPAISKKIHLFYNTHV